MCICSNTGNEGMQQYNMRNPKLKDVGRVIIVAELHKRKQTPIDRWVSIS